MPLAFGAMSSRFRWFLTDGLPIVLGLVVIPAVLVYLVVFVARAPQRAVHWWSCNNGTTGTPTWSPDGKQIAFVLTDLTSRILVENIYVKGSTHLALQDV